MVAGARLAASLEDVDTLILEGSGACVPPVEADATVCVVGEPADALDALGPVPPAARRPRAGDARRAARSSSSCRPRPWSQVRLQPEPAEQLPDGARVAFFSTGAGDLRGVEPVVTLAQPRAARGAGGGPRARRAGGLRRLPDRAEGGGDRHRRRARAPDRARASCSSATASSPTTAPTSTSGSPRSQPMAETIVTHRARGGLPYSKGLMTQSLSAIGVTPARAWELARLIEQRLEADAVDVDRVERAANAGRGGARAERGPRGGRALPRLGAPEPARPAARPAPVRDDRSRQVDARHDGRAPARRHARDRHGRDPSGAPGILLA